MVNMQMSCLQSTEAQIQHDTSTSSLYFVAKKFLPEIKEREVLYS